MMKGSVIWLVIVLAGVGGCAGDDGEGTGDASNDTGAAALTDDQEDSIEYHPAWLAELRGKIPEAYVRTPLTHDEQRIVIGHHQGGGPPTYGAYIKVSPSRDLTNSTIRDFPLNKWVDVALLNVEREDDSTKESGLPTGWSCIYIRLIEVNSLKERYGWQGLVLPAPTDLKCTAQQSTVPPNRRAWREREIGGYPGAVRLHVDKKHGQSKHHRFYVGARCGNGWCYVLQLPVWHTTPLGVPFHERIPGWHDEQILAYKSGPSVLPSPIRGKISPVDDLSTLQFDAVFQTAGFIDTKLVEDGAVPDPVLAAFRSHWGLPNWRVGRRIEVQLREVSAGSWQARYISGRDTSGFYTVTYMKYIPPRRPRGPATSVFMPIDIAGTARWGWSDGTESVWIRCEDGCCDVSAARIVTPQPTVDDQEKDRSTPAPTPDELKVESVLPTTRASQSSNGARRRG